jgi:hypothetical protein
VFEVLDLSMGKVSLQSSSCPAALSKRLQVMALGDRSRRPCALEAPTEKAPPLRLKDAAMKNALAHALANHKAAVTTCIRAQAAAPLAQRPVAAAASSVSSLASDAARVTMLVLAALLFTLVVLVGVSAAGGTKQPPRPSEQKVHQPKTLHYIPSPPSSLAAAMAL